MATDAPALPAAPEPSGNTGELAAPPVAPLSAEQLDALRERPLLIHSWPVEKIIEIIDAERAAREAAERERDELRIEARLFDQDAADIQQMIDRIAEIIGLPHDEALTITAFELWVQRNARAEAAERRARELEEALRPFAWFGQRLRLGKQVLKAPPDIEPEDGSCEVLVAGDHAGFQALWTEHFSAAAAALAARAEGA